MSGKGSKSWMGRSKLEKQKAGDADAGRTAMPYQQSAATNTDKRTMGNYDKNHW